MTTPQAEPETPFQVEGLTIECDEAKAVLADAVRLHEQGDFNAAVPFYIRAVTLAPNDPDILHASGIALGQAGKTREAIKHLTAALHFGKNSPDVWNALGMAFVELRALGNAERAFRQVVKRNPKSAMGWVQFGNFAYAAGQTELGAKRYDEAVKYPAQYADDLFAQSMIWLLRGQYRLGWRAYEARRDIGNWKIRNRQCANLKAPALGRTMVKKGTRILIEAEQGQGDAVMMARLIVPFAEHFGVTVVLQSHDALRDMLAGALPGVEVVNRSEIPEADGWVPLMSLPYYLRVPSPSWLPGPIAPFGERWTPPPRPDPLTSTISGNARRKPRIFVHQRGNAAHSYDFDRSVPSDAVLAPITESGKFEIVRAGFQAAGSDGEAVLMAEPTWRETVDLLKTCDRCLTVDTGLAHVAASLGMPTDIMIPTLPEWRWSLLDKTPWYSNVTLRRRTHTDAWAPMIERIAEDYAALG